MTPAEMMADAAALLNDQSQNIYTPLVLLSYYNQSIQKLQEILELNNIPVTNDTSAVLSVAANTTRIAFTGTTLQLPGDLIDIRQLWESPTGQNQWIPMTKKDYLPHSLEQVQTSQLMVFAWEGQEIKLLGSNSSNDIKMDYVKSIYQRITINDIITPVTTLNVTGFLTNYMAGMAAYFIGENESRATVLYGLADESLQRSLGISIKGQQSIVTRRRPFRSAYKQGNTVY